MNEKRLTIIVSPNKRCLLEPFNPEEEGKYLFFSFRCWPEGLQELIDNLIDSGDALVYLGDDVGNPISVFYKDMTFVIPGPLDADQDAAKMSQETWTKLSDRFVSEVINGE